MSDMNYSYKLTSGGRLDVEHARHVAPAVGVLVQLARCGLWHHVVQAVLVE
jgi:hypothetical protein